MSSSGQVGSRVRESRAEWHDPAPEMGVAWAGLAMCPSL